MELRSVGILALRELGEAWRNRWFLLYSVAFTLLALALSWLSVSGVAGTGFAGLGRTAASMLNLTVLIVPLMGLTLGAGALAPERESGALLYLLAQPVSALEVVLGKFAGLVAAVFAALLLGFGAAGLVIAGRGGAGAAAPYLVFLALGLLLAMATVAMGLAISALASKGSVATGVALFLWLALAFLGDLGVMGTSLALELSAGQLLAVALSNPLQVFKIASTLAIRGGLEVLGPAGAYALRAWGDGLLVLLVGLLLAWTAVPLAVAAGVTVRRGGLP